MRAKRVHLVAALGVLLSLLSMSWALFGQHLEALRQHLGRRLYYERVIKEKGLTLKRALYWRRLD
jgi:hypothetical protein